MRICDFKRSKADSHRIQLLGIFLIPYSSWFFLYLPLCFFSLLKELLKFKLIRARICICICISISLSCVYSVDELSILMLWIRCFPLLSDTVNICYWYCCKIWSFIKKSDFFLRKDTTSWWARPLRWVSTLCYHVPGSQMCRY